MFQAKSAGLLRQQRPFSSSLRPAVRPARRSAVIRAASNPAAAEKYDYIIVGGGTAGCVLANRLTADGSKKVLVLEAGGNGGALETRVPAALTRLFQHPKLDWNLFSSLQQLLGERSVYLARGKTLGGSSATNATLYLRGTAKDYDSWGLDGWRGNDVLDWFKSAESNGNMSAGPYHGAGGMMNVENPRYDSPLHEEFFRAARAAGLAENPDFNDWSQSQEGFGEFQVTTKRGQRADMFQQYLKPALGRANLKVVTGARTTRVALDKAGGGARAAGVEFSTEGPQGERFGAELAPGGEVLMCGGTVATPQLLMLSGVGPANHLRDHGINQLVDAPELGANLQDHPATLFAAKTKPEYMEMYITSQIYNAKNQLRLAPIAQLLLFGNGPLSSTGCDHGAFVRTRPGSGPADLQIRFVPSCALDPDAIQSYIKFAALKDQGIRWPGGVTMQLLTARPESRGQISLKSADPFDAPKVDLRYFSDEAGADLRTLVDGIKLARNIAQQGPLAQYLEAEQWPGTATSSDAEIEAYVRRSACSGNALVGTARMGASQADGSVVSARDMRVWGVANMRVIDASVIPVMPGGQTGAATVMVAEKAAALLTAAQSSRAADKAQPALV